MNVVYQEPNQQNDTRISFQNPLQYSLNKVMNIFYQKVQALNRERLHYETTYRVMKILCTADSLTIEASSFKLAIFEANLWQN